MMVSLSLPAAAQTPAEPTLAAAPTVPWTEGHQLSVMMGLTQWTLFRGGNVAAEYKWKRLALEVSHGQGLDLNQVGGFALTSAERDAGVKIRVPWTTGFGVGFRFTQNLHALVEFKAHHYEVTGLDPRVEVKYTTFSIGPGLFYTIPIWRGLFLQPNIRYWPNVGSTLSGNQVAIRQPDGTVYEHRAHDFGLFANMNLGYAF
ncbi:MAG TPA: hypothetical protein VHJ20_11185 [Polyangia bacterium]|nr:hypothetical protein [Polyangia bacterium]